MGIGDTKMAQHTALAYFRQIAGIHRCDQETEGGDHPEQRPNFSIIPKLRYPHISSIFLLQG
jgi:hypothetical protein